MATPDSRYSLTELAGLAGVTPRTVRYYMSQGLLPSSRAAGPGAKYDDADLGRLQLIRRLQREHLPLAEIRQRLGGLDDLTITALAEEPAAALDPADSALDYIRRVLSPDHRLADQSAGAYSRTTPLTPLLRRSAAVPAATEARTTITPGGEPTADRRFERSQWERIPLAPDIELHVRRPLPRPLAKQVDRLVSIARDLLEEDQS